MRLVGPDGCLQKNSSDMISRSGRMSKKQFLDNKIVAVSTPIDNLSNRTSLSIRVDTSYTVHSYDIFCRTGNKKKYITVNSNIITEEIKDFIRKLPNNKYDGEYLKLIFRNIKAAKNNGDTVRVKDFYISIPKEYYFPEIKNVHSKAKELMNEEFLFNRDDRTAPFGRGDAASAYYSFYDWRTEFKTKSPKVFLLDYIKYSKKYPLFDLSIRNYRSLKKYIKKSSMHFHFLTEIDRVIVTVAFGQLYLEGEIDNEIQKMTEDALVRQLNPKIISMWPTDYGEEREYKLKIMLKIIRKLK